jgi:hypothetical protein
MNRTTIAQNTIRGYDRVRVGSVDPKRVYTLLDMVKCKVFPFAKNLRTIRKIIEVDRQCKNLLGAEITGDGKTRRYLVKGAGIIKFLEVHGAVLTAFKR